MRCILSEKAWNRKAQKGTQLRKALAFFREMRYNTINRTHVLFLLPEEKNLQDLECRRRTGSVQDDIRRNGVRRMTEKFGAGEPKSLKVYVGVGAEFTEEGYFRPLWIRWEDGTKYMIDKVRDCRRAASRRAGGVGIRYLCTVRGHDVELFYEENNQWFVTRA